MDIGHGGISPCHRTTGRWRQFRVYILFTLRKTFLILLGLCMIIEVYTPFKLNISVMNHNVATLSSFFPAWESISEKYELLFSNLEKNIRDQIKREEKEESLHWEQFAFELMITILLAKHLPFDTSDNDVQPLVKDVNGLEKEIDFRIRIMGEEVYLASPISMVAGKTWKRIQRMLISRYLK